MTDRRMADHGWQGRGRLRAARVDGALVLRFASLSTRGGALQDDMGAFFRKDYRRVSPDFEPYAVRIWVEVGEWRRKIDVDNVAKACLDALTGVVWRDDRQVVRLAVEKVPSDAEGIVLAVQPVAEPTVSPDLEDLMTKIETLETA